jgi:enamine deaminase RidA (YjgF/YER057c/UK114 family)
MGYSHVARLGDLLFVSGQVSKNEHDEPVGVGDAERQTEVVYENLKRVLEEAGSGLDLIGKTTVFTTSLEHRPAINRVRERVFGPIGRYPASTFVVVTSLAVPEWLVEIEVIAVVRKSG